MFITLFTRFFVFVSLCAFSYFAHGQSINIDSARVESLASSSSWRALLHYHPDGDGWRSQADDDQFFNAVNGVSHPVDELMATLQALQAPLQGKPADEHAQCLFPARYHWLKQQLPELEAHAPVLRCEKFESWLTEIKPHSATLIFPAAYINSPSSMFGHTLVRIDGKDQNDKTRILAYSISYAAEMPESVNSWDYVWGGLFGGYPGFLNGAAYYDKVIEYNDIEARDIWEYRLDLTQAELEQMIRHIWELQQVTFDYYFFDENCSFRLLTILDVARPGLDSAGEFFYQAIPADTVRVLQDKGVLKERVYRPSALTELRYRAGQMTRSQRRFAKMLALGEQSIEQTLSQMGAPHGEEEKALVVDYAFDYLRYLARRDPINKKRHGQRSLQLLSARSKLPEHPVPAVPAPTSPEQGHGTARLDVYTGEREQESFAGLRLRPAFHDVMDNDQGYVSGAQINFLALDGRYYHQRQSAELERFTLVDITALSPRNMFFKPLSWAINVGWQRVHEKPEHSLRFSLQGGGGITQEFGESLRFSLMGLGNVRSRAAFQSDWEAGAGIDASVIWSLPKHSKLRLSAASWDYDGRNVSDGQRYSATLNLPLFNVDHALRLDYRHEALLYSDSETATLSWNYYF